MAFVSCTDNVNFIEVIVFSNIIDSLININVNDIVVINGKVERRYNNYQIIAKEIKKID